MEGNDEVVPWGLDEPEICVVVLFIRHSGGWGKKVSYLSTDVILM